MFHHILRTSKPTIRKFCTSSRKIEIGDNVFWVSIIFGVLSYWTIDSFNTVRIKKIEMENNCNNEIQLKFNKINEELRLMHGLMKGDFSQFETFVAQQRKLIKQNGELVVQNQKLLNQVASAQSVME